MQCAPQFRQLYALALILAMVFAVGGKRANAQVNTALSAHPTAGVSGQLEGSLTGRTGNTTGIIAGAAASLTANYEPHIAILRASGDYTRFDHNTNVAKSFAYARYGYQFLPWLAGEIYGQLQSDRFRRLKLRKLAGIGPRFTLLDIETLAVFSGVSYMWEYEVLDIEPGSLDSAHVITHRSNIYLSIYANIDKRLVFSTVNYLQPSLEDPSNLRYLNESSFTFDITKTLSTRLTGSFRFDSVPPSGVVPTDLEIKNSFVVKF